jgi:predicted ATPase/DNA-binding SARP family transcriptional activator
MLTIRLFGAFEVRVDGAPLPHLRTRKGEWLLALLVMRGGREVERDWLTAALWPECPDSRARKSLRVSLTDLRHAFGEHARRLQAPTPRTLSLDLTDAEVDLLTFDAALADGSPTALEQAVALYRGPFLTGCPQDWAFQERQGREQAYLSALETLAAQAMALGDPATAERHLRRAVGTDPLRESTQRSLMQALAAHGHHAAAFQVYRDLRLLLHREINAAPDPETVALFQQIQADAARRTGEDRNGAPSRPGAGAGVRSALVLREPPGHNLPQPVTRFISREQEVAEVRHLLLGWADEGGQAEETSGPLSPVCRLLTITGAGGCGKSRLALEAVRALLTDPEDGVWLVELASLANPDLVPPAVAKVLGVAERPSEPVTETLVAFLKSKRLLLLLDNCEHLLAACGTLADALLRHCPAVRILATSREPLSILGETTYRIPGLSLPPEGVGRPGAREADGSSVGPATPKTQEPIPNTLLSSGAVCLFLDRACAADPSFELTARSAGAVARICRRLDGIPLTLEMAAARLRAMPVETLAERLTDCFRLLTDGNRAALPRHRTLRAMIEWSYDLLSEPEKILLRRLSVFAGGWTLEAVEQVCGDFGVRVLDFGLGSDREPIQNTKPKIENAQVFDLLTHLVDKSLVVLEERGGEGRYRFLETIRQLAQECLLASGEVETARQRHAEYYLRLAETAEPHLEGPDQGPWSDRLERELDNLRAVLAWSTEQPNPGPAGKAVEVGLRLSAAMRRFWYVRGYATEGRDWLERLLLLADGDLPERPLASKTVRARAFHTAGRLAWWQGEGNVAQTLYQQGLCLAQETGDRDLIARLLQGLGAVANYLGEFGPAKQRLEESLAIARELGDRRMIALLCNSLGMTAIEQGDYERARPLLEGSLRFYREVGDRAFAKHPLINLGSVSTLQGDYAAASVCLEEALTICRELGDQGHVAIVLEYLGSLARHQDDLETARAHHTEALRLHRALGNRGELVRSLTGLGCAEVMTGEKAAGSGEAAGRWFARGARLFGVAETLYRATGWVVWACHRADYPRCVAAARAALGEDAFAAAWEEGRAMPLEAAVEYALGEVRM